MKGRRTQPFCSHAICSVAPFENTTAPFPGLHLMGGTGLEPVTPSLSSFGGRSRPFAPVRELAQIRRFRATAYNASEPERPPSAAIAATRYGYRPAVQIRAATLIRVDLPRMVPRRLRRHTEVRANSTRPSFATVVTALPPRMVQRPRVEVDRAGGECPINCVGMDSRKEIRVNDNYNQVGRFCGSVWRRRGAERARRASEATRWRGALGGPEVGARRRGQSPSAG